MNTDRYTYNNSKTFNLKVNVNFNTNAMVKNSKICTIDVGLWLKVFVLCLTGLQLSSIAEKIISVTRLNLLQDFLQASRGLCGAREI